MPETHEPWWKGSRGEWLVAVQLVLMALVFLGPRRLPGWPASTQVLPGWLPVAGTLLMVAGGALMLAALVHLGAGLTPLPYPKDGALLVVSGPYALVRHPMYSGGLLLALGWALHVHGVLTLAYVAVLFAFLDRKSAREEQWLAARFAGYDAYRRRVRKLVPFLY